MVVATIVLHNVFTVSVLLRFGLVGLIATALVLKLGPLTQTADWTAWHAQPAIMAMVAVAALAAYGYMCGEGRKKLRPRSHRRMNLAIACLTGRQVVTQNERRSPQ